MADPETPEVTAASGHSPGASAQPEGGEMREDSFTTLEPGAWETASAEQLRRSVIMQEFVHILDIRDRKYHFRTYTNCFIASEAVDAIIQNQLAGITDRVTATRFCERVRSLGLIRHSVDSQKTFQDKYLFFVLGGQAIVSIDQVLPVSLPAGDGFPVHSRVSQHPVARPGRPESLGAGMPDDEHKQTLLDHIHPEQWPPAEHAHLRTKRRYNMVVIGGGAAGLVTSAIVAAVGGTVALVEEEYLGGDCLVHGCVPSKALLACAHRAEVVRRGAAYGLTGGESAGIAFPVVMERMRRLRAKIAENDSAKRFASLGVHVSFGHASFTSDRTVQVVDPAGATKETFEFSRCTIASGAKPTAPPVPGLEDVGYCTNETIFNLTTLPKTLVVIGGGPIGCELGQAFASFGSQVHLFEYGPSVLGRDEPTAAKRVIASLEKTAGLHIYTSARMGQISMAKDGQKELRYQIAAKDGQTGDEQTLVADLILVATGRRPNLVGLGLDKAGIELTDRGLLKLDPYLQTTNPRVFAGGDVAAGYQFTHTANHMARIVVRNALFFGRNQVSSLIVPWCTFTYPELAHVGRLPGQIPSVQVFSHELCDVDRAILEGETGGIVQVYVAAGSDQVLGATIVAPDAGNMIGYYTLAMNAQIGLRAMATVIHPYPSLGDAFASVSDAFGRTRLTPTARTVLEQFIKLRR